MRFLVAGILSIVLLALVGVGVVAWDSGDRMAASGFWTAGVMGFGLLCMFLAPRTS